MEIPINYSSYIQQLYISYKKDPTSLSKDWQLFFQGYDLGTEKESTDSVSDTTTIDEKTIEEEIKVCELIAAYRSRGHLEAKTNPIRDRKDRKANLKLKDFGLSEDLLKKKFSSGKILKTKPIPQTLEEIEKTLQKIYADVIGFEYMAIRKPEILNWFQDKIENKMLDFSSQLTNEEKKHFLSKLIQSTHFEEFLHKKYIGQKRFSLEGGEATIPALDIIIEKGIKLGAKEFCIGMAHRGRLNILANILQKPFEKIFHEFEGGSNLSENLGDGDVKYHLNYSSFLKMGEEKIRLDVLPNPSHLETINSVLHGHVKARLDQKFSSDFNKVIPILIHGDAAIAGQGIVYEILQMSQLKGYNIGGTIHFIINNQVGFTADFHETRSSIYCTTLSGMVEAPELHVNGDDIEAVAFTAQLAIEFRQKYHRDIFIDLVCYRKYGHNESDEPKFTQPVLYDIIKKHDNSKTIYSNQLIEQQIITKQEIKEEEKIFENKLEKALKKAKNTVFKTSIQVSDRHWKKFKIAKLQDFFTPVHTGISAEEITKIASALIKLPQNFQPLKQIQKLLSQREKNFFETKILNWADAELLSYGALLLENYSVRMSGQDVKRGTFSHRHAIVKDIKTNEEYSFLNHINDSQAEMMIYNSILSEYGVLGFEYGYASSNPNCLVIWEAQFGDFANGAQIIIDQFLVSSESKWLKMSGLVLLLPHGYEGQGPEHSNARPERYLQLCAENNIVVANITTPANLFHILRRQMLWNFRKPCVIMSPKSLLRHPMVKSPIQDFLSDSRFKEIIVDTSEDETKIDKVLLCTGKVYYDLLDYKIKNKIKETAVIRIEQLHPFPEEELEVCLSCYKNLKKLIWVQEEPVNMGYWTYILRTYYKRKDLELVARKPSASPATGVLSVHKREQDRIVSSAFHR